MLNHVTRHCESKMATLSFTRLKPAHFTHVVSKMAFYVWQIRFSFLAQNSNEGNPARNGAMVAYIQNHDSHSRNTAKDSSIFAKVFFFRSNTNFHIKTTPCPIFACDANLKGLCSLRVCKQHLDTHTAHHATFNTIPLICILRHTAGFKFTL